MTTDLSDLMSGVLRALREMEGDNTYRPFPASHIAYRMGLDGPRRLGNGASKGSWSGHMSPAQRIIFPLNALRKRGLVDFGQRPDGYSGTAYYLTAEGRALVDNDG